MAKSKRDALLDIGGQFAEAQAVITTAQRALDERQPECDEAITLRVGIKMLNDAYNALDAAIPARNSRSVRPTDTRDPLAS